MCVAGRTEHPAPIIVPYGDISGAHERKLKRSTSTHMPSLRDCGVQMIVFR